MHVVSSISNRVASDGEFVAYLQRRLSARACESLPRDRPNHARQGVVIASMASQCNSHSYSSELALLRPYISVKVLFCHMLLASKRRVAAKRTCAHIGPAAEFHCLCFVIRVDPMRSDGQAPAHRLGKAFLTRNPTVSRLDGSSLGKGSPFRGMGSPSHGGLGS